MTKPRNTPRGVECVDCAAHREALGRPRPTNLRPAPYGGVRTPLCASHFRARKKLSKSGSHERRVQKVYGLKPGEYGQMYLAQGGKCAICRRADGSTRRLSVDHDHRTGLARILACRPCNDMLGHARDDPEFFRRAIAALVSPTAKQLGIIAIHEDFRKEKPDV